MNTLIEKLELQARENPKETILFDETVTKGIEPFPKKWTRKMRKKQNEANRSE